MRITELFTAKSIELDSAASNRDEILSRLVELQATHGNITDTEAYKKALYAREDEASTYVDNGITVPHAKTNVVTRPSLAALRLSTPVQYNAEDDGKTDLLFAIAAPENGSLHVDMLARMMQMLMNEDFVEKLKAAKTPAEFLALIDAQEEAQFGEESFTQQVIPQSGYRILAVTACPNGIAHTYMAAEALAKAGDKLDLPTKVETNGSDGAKNVLTRAEIAACDGIIVAADKNVETARFDGKPVLFARVDDGIHKPEELLKKVAHGEVPVYHAKGGAAAAEEETSGDSFGRKVYKDLMNGVSHMLPFVVGGGIMIALAFLLDDYTIDPSNFGMNTPIASFFKTVGSAAFGYMLPILAGFIAMSIADRPGLAVGFAGGVLAMNGTNFAGLANGETTGISGGFLAALLAGFVAGYVVEFLKKITEKLPASLNGIRPMLIYPLGGILIIGAVMCGINPVMGMINTAMTNCLNAMGGTSKVLLGAIVAGMMSIDMGGPFNKAAYVFGTAALASGNYEVMAAVMVGGMVPPIAIALSTQVLTSDTESHGIEMAALPCPSFAGCEPVAVQQGAGMVVIPGTEDEISACVAFLKWFTQPENNLQFSVQSGYMPVTYAANSISALENSGLTVSESIRKVLSLSIDTVDRSKLYTTHAFPDALRARNTLQYALEDRVTADRATVLERLAAGQTPEEAEAEFLTDAYFDAWYDQTLAALSAFAG